MKAKIIKTGEVVEVHKTTTGWASDNLNTTRFFNESELDFDYREWEIFRREAAKDVLSRFPFLDSLPEEKPIEKDEKIEALIARDIMEATAKRVNIDKQDKDKEEEAMLEKINYLRNLGLNE